MEGTKLEINEIKSHIRYYQNDKSRNLMDDFMNSNKNLNYL